MTKTDTQAKKLLLLLEREFPTVFNDSITDCGPIEIGIHQALYPWAKEKGYSGTALGQAERTSK